MTRRSMRAMYVEPRKSVYLTGTLRKDHEIVADMGSSRYIGFGSSLRIWGERGLIERLLEWVVDT